LLLKEEGIQLLTKIGLTKTQAKIYLTLLKNGNARARALAELANSPRPLVYRTLDELQKMGLVEKEISTPYKYSAVPPDPGLQILVYNKFRHYKDIQEETKLFVHEFEKKYTDPSLKQENWFKMVESKERILQIMKSQHRNVQQSSDITSVFRRWVSILDFCIDDYEKALQRNVKYRIIVEISKRNIDIPENFRVLLNYPNFHLKLSNKRIGSNLAIFDGKEATFNCLQSKSLKESPIFWTNNPSFILMAQDHFDKVWKSARKYTLEDN
jgi:HTH-type transcriptional regulator, sugar sensing transcriptional regulator